MISERLDEPEAVPGLEEVVMGADALTAIIVESLRAIPATVNLDQFRVITALAELGSMRIGDLARHMEANQSSFSRFASRLVDLGLISRRISPTNRREIIVEIAPEGQRIYRNVMDSRERQLARVLLVLEPSELELVKQSSVAFVRAVNRTLPK